MLFVFSKFVSEVATLYYELRKEGTSSPNAPEKKLPKVTSADTFGFQIMQYRPHQGLKVPLLDSNRSNAICPLPV